MRLKLIFSAIFISILAGISCIAIADSWGLPAKKIYYSPNKKYYIEVAPKELES